MQRTIELLALGALAVVLMASPAHPDERRYKVFGAYDYFFPSNSEEGLRNQLQAESDGLIAGGYDSTAFSVSATGGKGARVGVLFPWYRRTMLGGNLGYVLGPTMNANFTALSGAFGNGGMTISRAVSYVRLLGEIQVDLLKRGPWDVRLDSGWGLGIGLVDQSCTPSGSLTCPSRSSKVWPGFTWEVSPMLSYRLKDAELNIGPRYAGFPRFRGTDQIAPIQWQAIGLFFGAAF